MDIRIIKSNRKTLALQISRTGEVIVRSPLWATDMQIQKFVHEKKDWILQHLKKYQEEKRNLPAEKLFTMDELIAMAEKAKKLLPERVRHFAPLVGVKYGRITIRNQRSRWGSCSSAGNLNFNCLLVLLPAEVIDYVVVHELCHRKHMNHSPAFWEEVGKVCPDYKKHDQWLKKNGPAVIRRMTG